MTAESGLPVRRPEEKKERKGAGVPLGEGPLGFGRFAAEFAERLESGSRLGALLRSPAGGWVSLLLFFAGGTALGVGAMSLRRPSRAPEAASSTAAPALAPVGSGIVIRKPRDRSLGYVARANEGELSFGDRPPTAPIEDNGTPEPKRPPPPALPAAGAGAAGGQAETVGPPPTPPAQAPALPPSLPPGGAQPPRLKAAFGAFQLQTPSALPRLEQPKPASFGPRPVRAAARELTLRRVAAPRPMSQLKAANALSRAALAGAEESASHAASNAFEQVRSEGGEFSPVMPGAPDVVVPLGGGAPDPNGSRAPEAGKTENVTPYQPYLDAARDMTDSSGRMRWLALAFLAAGAALIAAGIAMLSSLFGSWAAWGLIAAGLSMSGTGIMMLAMSRNLADQARQIADTIRGGFQQADQGNIVDQAAGGIPFSTTDLTRKLGQDAVRRAVQQQRDASYR